MATPSHLVGLPRRPWARTDVPLLWTADDALLVGDDERQVLITDIERDLVAWLLALDGDRTLAVALRDADRLGLGRQRPVTLLRAVAHTGLLDDAAVMPESLREAALHVRDSLAADLAAARHAYGTGQRAAEAIERRRRAQVAVHGDGPVAEAVALALTQAGVGTLLREAPQRSSSRKARRLSTERDLYVLCHARHPDQFDDAGAMSVDVPHLPVCVFGSRAVIGPLVLPGTTGCLRCAELHRADAEPAWPRIAAQLAHRRWGPTPVDSALVTMAAGLAALQVLAFVESADREDRTGRIRDASTTEVPAVGHRLLARLPGGWVDRIAAPAHPLCGCRWPAAA